MTDKVSQNLHAEIMLREVGAIRRNVGSREAGLADLGDFLNEIGTDPDQYRFVDGSGLSRETLLAPAAVTKLLEFMAQSKQRDLWINLLPVAGVDGTLGTRFAGHPEAKHIHAKTGSLAHIRALSGYADTKENGMVAFSIMVNNFDVPSDEITAFMDRMSLALLQ